LHRVWDSQQRTQLTDASATLILSQDLPVALLEQTSREGSAETTALAQETLKEWMSQNNKSNDK